MARRARSEPKVPEDQREAWPLETARRVRDAINERYRIAVVIALGCGLRQGEVFGLSPEDVDFARGVLRIRRQVQLLHGRLYFTLPKGGKTRVVDMPPSVAAALAQYFMEYPAVEVELPWGRPGARSRDAEVPARDHDDVRQRYPREHLQRRGVEAGPGSRRRHPYAEEG